MSVANGLLEKAGRQRAPIADAFIAHSQALHRPGCDFDLFKLADQVKNECVWPTAHGNAALYGNADQQSQGYCEGLVSRINTLIHSKELECIFKSNGTSLADELLAFFGDDTRDIAIISFKDVRFEHNTREILLNIIGRYLLGRSRVGDFREHPLVVFLDEAHHFLGRTIGDDYAAVRLDSFGLIAKEGRKYGLTCVLATQRPRDIPQDVLSQLGTLFVHRLTNHLDRETVERACGDLDRGAAQFVPMLAPGEAVVIGPDLPAPVPMFIHAPTQPPDSKGPGFQEFWTNRKAHPRPAPIRPALVQPQQALPILAQPDIDLDDDVPF